MSSLANQQQNLSFPGLLQVPGGITSLLYNKFKMVMEMLQA
jgi:hypothetical protein